MNHSLEPASILTTLDSLFDTITPKTQGEKFLRFQITKEDTALLPVKDIVGVTTVVATEILPVPEMPASVLGIYNWRGEMLWLIDLALMLGFAPLNWYECGEAALAIAVQAEEQTLGVLAAQIHDIEVYDPQQIQPPPLGIFPPVLLPYMSGYLADSTTAVLSASALVGDSQWQIHARNNA